MLSTLLAVYLRRPNVRRTPGAGNRENTTCKVHRMVTTFSTSGAQRDGEGEWPRKEFIYWTDDGSVAALRLGDWKTTFPVQKAHSLNVWIRAIRFVRATDSGQPAYGSFGRRRRGYLNPYFRTCRSHVPDRSVRRLCGAVDAELGVSATHEAWQFQPEQGDGGHAGNPVREQPRPKVTPGCHCNSKNQGHGPGFLCPGN